MTGLLVVLLLLVVAAVVADRLAARAVEQAVAVRLATSGQLEGTPEVEVRGMPFLTQAARGRYSDVVFRAAAVQAGPVRLRQFVARLHGVELPLRDVLSGSVVAVPVASGTARGVLTYADLTAVVADRGLRVTPAGGGRARVTGSVQVLGRTVEASAISRPTLEGREVVVTAERFEVGNAVADAVLSAALGNRLDFRVDLGPLPYGLELTDLRAGGDGVVVHAASRGAVLRALRGS